MLYVVRNKIAENLWHVISVAPSQPTCLEIHPHWETWWSKDLQLLCPLLFCGISSYLTTITWSQTLVLNDHPRQASGDGQEPLLFLGNLPGERQAPRPGAQRGWDLPSGWPIQMCLLCATCPEKSPRQTPALSPAAGNEEPVFFPVRVNKTSNL